MNQNWMMIEDFDAGVNQEYTASVYPQREGFYFNQRLKQVFLVYAMNGTSARSVFGCPAGWLPVVHSRGPHGDMLSFDDLMRAIAVCLHPEAAAKEMDRQRP